mmetsp:Transcript_5983/g.11309  ORF Transcript_5983/g.11309 Transcript_5983/m.11309 type:complete len:404 (+) Transcript_5983:135-1346(+)
MEKVKDGDKDQDKEREETAEEKVDRLAIEVCGLIDQLLTLQCSLPPITEPPFPEPWLKLRRAIKEKETERELLLEDQRASKVVEEYLQENPSILERVDECPVCLDPIFDVHGAVTFPCCGKRMCQSCLAPLRATAKNTCPLCRGRFPCESERIRILRTKAEEGKAWAQCSLGTAYRQGSVGILEADDQKAESLFRKAAEQGHSNAQFLLGRFERTRENFSEACQLFEAAASQGHMNALGLLGVQYRTGFGVEVDLVKSVRFLTISAKLQNTDLSVHTTLGLFYMKCFIDREQKSEGGLKPSPIRSAHYMKPAIERGDKFAAPANLYALQLLLISYRYYPDILVPPSGYNILPEVLFWYRHEGELLETVKSFESAIKELCASCYKPLTTDAKVLRRMQSCLLLQ